MKYYNTFTLGRLLTLQNAKYTKVCVSTNNREIGSYFGQCVVI